MLEFKELKITTDNKQLIIDVSVKNLAYYNNVYIDTIIIDTQDTYIDSGSSSNPVFTYKVSGNEKEVRLELNETVLKSSLSDTMFFVYAVAKGTPSADTPCSMDNQTTIGVAYNLYPFYRHMLNCMKEIECRCEIPRNFIDSILRFKALELCIKTQNFLQAIKYWNKFFRGVKIKTINTGCKCHG